MVIGAQKHFLSAPGVSWVIPNIPTEGGKPIQTLNDRACGYCHLLIVDLILKRPITHNHFSDFYAVLY